MIFFIGDGLVPIAGFAGENSNKPGMVFSPVVVDVLHLTEYKL